MFEDSLGRFKVQPEDLVLEITESASVKNG
jgi:EAL domain-containing protein (putative c-di-GMP-specific phosphodiesterase class I)